VGLAAPRLLIKVRKICLL